MFITLAEWAMYIGGIAFWINLLVMLPLSFINKTKGFSAVWMFNLSMVMMFGIWAGCAVYTFMAWGIIALVIGLLIAGVGVVPMALLHMFLNGYWMGFFGIIIYSVIIRLFWMRSMVVAEQL